MSLVSSEFTLTLFSEAGINKTMSFLTAAWSGFTEGDHNAIDKDPKVGYFYRLVREYFNSL